MWIKGFRSLKIKIRVEDKRCLYLPFPIPFSIMQELLECILDLLHVICFFVPKLSEGDSESQMTVHSVKKIVIMVLKSLDSLLGEEPFDFIDVTTGKVEVTIKVR